jgi:hypothetical protein
MSARFACFALHERHPVRNQHGRISTPLCAALCAALRCAALHKLHCMRCTVQHMCAALHAHGAA